MVACRAITPTIALGLGLLLVAPSAEAQDTDDLRGYLNVRLGITAASDTDVAASDRSTSIPC